MRIVLCEAGVEYNCATDITISSPEHVLNIPYVNEIMQDDQENFCIAILNTRNGLKSCELITRGILNACIVHAREVFKIAIEKSAAAIILIHNHPSGSLTPSSEDISLTKHLINAGKIIDIKVLDHVIVNKNKQAFSLREEGITQF